MAKAPEKFHACEFQTPATSAAVQLFRSNARSFAAEGTEEPRIQVGVLLRGMVRTETAGGLLVSDAREAPRVWIMPAHTTYAVTAIPGHAPENLGASMDARVFSHYLEEAAGARLSLPETPLVLADPVAALGLQAFHQSLWSGAGSLEWESWLVTSLRRLFGGAAEGKGPLSEPRGVALAREYLHAHPGEQVPLDKLAAVAGLSKYHLVRAFRAAVGMPPHAYQLRLRLTRSLFLLRQGQPPSVIAYELGFADQSHYTRAFRAEFGTTPGAWLRDLARPRARARLDVPPAPASTGARAWRATAWPSTDPRPAPRTPHS
ncbi:AraC family transcriptional regulator [Polyangium sp. y55x31]|uniref:helix-turn-helix transcriptional regulator n=1 Tax=Polyangium sp. y55x31 TaxID=3042688 RepID=UPI0024825BC1|nr:AraC family transcriptional regulator [Polyangium sp. y55x31]